MFLPMSAAAAVVAATSAVRISGHTATAACVTKQKDYDEKDAPIISATH